MLANEQANLERIARSLRDWGAAVSTHVVWQPAVHDGLLRHIDEWQPDLVVAGAHHRGRVPHVRLAETDWHLLRSCPRPLLIAKDPTFASYRRVLAAVDPLGSHEEPPGLERRCRTLSRSRHASPKQWADAYLAAGVLFIFSLGGLSAQESARRGNLFGIRRRIKPVGTERDQQRSGRDVSQRVGQAPSSILSREVEIRQRSRRVEIGIGIEPPNEAIRCA